MEFCSESCVTVREQERQLEVWEDLDTEGSFLNISLLSQRQTDRECEKKKRHDMAKKLIQLPMANY